MKSDPNTLDLLEFTVFNKIDAHYLMEWKRIGKQKIWRDSPQELRTSRLGLLT